MYEFVVARLLRKPAEFATQKAYWANVSAATQIPVRTVEKIARREIEDPGVRNIEKIAEHFDYTPQRARALARLVSREQRAIAAP